MPINSPSKVAEKKSKRALEIKNILRQLPTGTSFKKITNVVDYVTKQLRASGMEYKAVHRTTIKNCKYCMDEIEKWWQSNTEVLKKNDIHKKSAPALQALLLKEKLTVSTLQAKIKNIELKNNSVADYSNKSDDSHIALFLLLKYLDMHDFGVSFNKKHSTIIDNAHQNNITIVSENRLRSYMAWLKLNDTALPLLDKLSSDTSNGK